MLQCARLIVASRRVIRSCQVDGELYLLFFEVASSNRPDFYNKLRPDIYVRLSKFSCVKYFLVRSYDSLNTCIRIVCFHHMTRDDQGLLIVLS